MNLLFVCLGNICRSPIAEGIFQNKANQLGYQWKCSSAGTAGYHTGSAPHKLSQKVCQNNGIDIRRLTAKQLTYSMIADYDRLFALDVQNLRDIRALDTAQQHLHKIQLITSIIPGYPALSVPDPYYGDFADYENVFGIINELCEQFFKDYSNQS